MHQQNSNTQHPYRMPHKLTCDPAEIEGGVSMELVDKYIDKHEQFVRRYRYLTDMFLGFHDIYNGPEKEEWKPDNRIAVNFPKYLVTTFEGYAYGLPPKITHPDDRINEEMQGFLDRNSFADTFSELTKYSSIEGHAWAYLYQDEDAETRLTFFKPDNLFCVYDDSVVNRALFYVRYGYRDPDSDHPGEKYGEVVTPNEIRRFSGDSFVGDPQINPYGMLNVVECRMNDERTSLFEDVCGMTELYDRTLSEKGNDVDAFAEAYLAIIGTEVDDEGVRRIRDDRIINIYGTDDADEVKNSVVEFLQKPTADSTQENLLDRLEKMIFQISMVANISDESFGNATSGVAIGYKLWATSNLGTTFDNKNRKTIQKIFKIWCSLAKNCPKPDAWKDLNIKFYRNTPNNISEEVANARDISGVVSQHTQLSLLSFVDDPDKEIERMQKEDEDKAKNLDIYGDLKAAAGLAENGEQDDQGKDDQQDVTDEKQEQ